MSCDGIVACKDSVVEKFAGVLRIAVPGSSGTALTLPDLALQVGEEEAGGGRARWGGRCCGECSTCTSSPPCKPSSILFPHKCWARNPAYYLPRCWLQQQGCCREYTASPRGVLADAVDAGQGGVAGGEEDAGVDQLELTRTKVCDVGASRALTTKLTALPKSQDRRLNGDHTLVKSTSLLLSLTFSIWEPKKKISDL